MPVELTPVGRSGLPSPLARQSVVPVAAVRAAMESAGASLEDRDRLIATLQSLGGMSATVVGRDASGYTVDMDGFRFSLPLAQTFAAGETLLIALGGGDGTTPQGAPGSSGEPVTLSDAARLIGRALAEAAKADRSGKAASTTGTAPLSARPGDADSIASGLKKALAESGLFYESHLARWTEGDYPLEDLRKEPQSRETAGERQAAAARTETLPSLVARQLDTLERNAVRWRGEVWPGQEGGMEISNETPAGSSPAARQTWRVRMALDLPDLGKVEADLQLVGDAVAVRLASEDASSSGRLAAARESLRSALGARGMSSATVTVSEARNVH